MLIPLSINLGGHGRSVPKIGLHHQQVTRTLVHLRGEPVPKLMSSKRKFERLEVRRNESGQLSMSLLSPGQPQTTARPPQEGIELPQNRRGERHSSRASTFPDDDQQDRKSVV